MIKLDTSNILFIVGGAFVGLDKVIESRVSQHPMGFGAEVKTRSEQNIEELFAQMLPDDLIKYGLIPEFIGRVPIQVALRDLDKEDFIRIVTEPKNSILKQYQASLKLDDVDLVFEDEAVAAISEKAMERKTGARGLRSIVENVMTDIMFDIPSIEGKKRVVITRAVIEQQEKPEIVQVRKSA